ncbi:gag protease polyprotein [Cucumis melo var. makuwa]|uniref:Gag protease polyprotein n=1 Tax=Cucumis melo var. makuwa TaxID=1194695 RepID=A0A5D3BPN8_CUCMM|nr:gag protease polyprotein [Cucumis melo var. makuwa]
MFSIVSVKEVTLEFRSSTASAVGANSPLLGWIHLDADLNANLATFQTPMPKCSVYCSYVGHWLWSYVMEGLRVRKPLVYIEWFSIDYGVTVSFIYKVVYLTGTVSFGIPRLICVSFGITRLICASFGITRLICASFGITRLICASFGIIRLICASFGITRLMCKGMARGRPAKGKKDAWSHVCRDLSLVRKVGSLQLGWPRRLRKGSRTCQPEVQPVAQATDPTAPATHANLAAIELRFKDLIMQMREQQQPVPPAPAPVVPQVVPDQLSAEAKHLGDFRKYNPTTFDRPLEDFTKAQMWLSSLETIFRQRYCLVENGREDVRGDVGQITWKQFKESFYAKFFSASLRDAKWQEFLNLEQDDRTVE